ncbi:8137_t:CDS:2, partial [Ambispora leptoticha]
MEKTIERNNISMEEDEKYPSILLSVQETENPPQIYTTKHTIVYNKTNNMMTIENSFPSSLLIAINSIEIFANICRFLSPTDLYSLSLTCLKFNEILASTIDSVTQQIWESSRRGFCEFLQMPPPAGMPEQEYQELVKSDGCQLCYDENYCKVKVETTLRDIWEVPDDLINIFAPLTPRDIFKDGVRYYWAHSISSYIQDYISLERKEKKNWLTNKKLELENAIHDTIEREYWDHCRLLKKQSLRIPNENAPFCEFANYGMEFDEGEQQIEFKTPSFADFVAFLEILRIFRRQIRIYVKSRDLIQEESDESTKTSLSRSLPVYEVHQTRARKRQLETKKMPKVKILCFNEFIKVDLTFSSIVSTFSLKFVFKASISCKGVKLGDDVGGTDNN